MIARLNPKVSKRHQLCAAGRSQLGAVVVVVALGFIMSGCVNCIPDISVASSASNCTVIEHNGTQREKCIFCNKVLKSSHCKFPSLHPKMFHFLNQKLIYMPDCSFRDQGNWSDPFPYKKIQFNFFLVIRYWQGRHRPIILWKIYQHPPQSEGGWRCLVTDTPSHQLRSAFTTADKPQAISVRGRSRAFTIPAHSFHFVFKFSSSSTCYCQKRQG